MSTELLSSCPVCHSEDLSASIQVKDYLVSRETFTLTACSSCSFLFTNPRPDETSVSDYYKSDEYVSHNDSNKGLIHQLYQTVKSITIRSKYKLLRGSGLSSKGFSLLDYGCGTGSLLEAVKQKGNVVTGIEPDPGARALADAKTGQVFSTLSEIPEGASFDAITLWHVLEHVHKLDQTIHDLTTHLHERGRMFIAVPNRSSYDAKALGVDWAAYDVPRHLYHFTREPLQQLMRKHGLELIFVKPMWFDSFYVAMLSYKNKGSKLFFLRGMWTGFISNLLAIFTGEFSSRIYVFKKING